MKAIHVSRDYKILKHNGRIHKSGRHKVRARRVLCAVCVILRKLRARSGANRYEYGYIIHRVYAALSHFAMDECDKVHYQNQHCENALILSNLFTRTEYWDWN